MTIADGFVSGDPLAVDGGLRRNAIDRLLDDAGPFGWSTVHPYRKWQGAFWRLLALLDLEAAPREIPEAMIELVFGWLTSAGRRRRVRASMVEGRMRWCATQDGLAIWLACRLGHADDPRTGLLAESLIDWQWPDGGWNCDKRPEADHSAFSETHGPLRGLSTYHVATGDPAALDAARRAADFLLAHRLFRSERTGAVIHGEWLNIHWPPYWHYDVLLGLRTIAANGGLDDGRVTEALDLLDAARRPDGTWRTSGSRWWKRPGGKGSNVEVVDWSDVANQVVTAQVEAVMRQAGRAVTASSA